MTIVNAWDELGRILESMSQKMLGSGSQEAHRRLPCLREDHNLAQLCIPVPAIGMADAEAPVSHVQVVKIRETNARLFIAVILVD